MTRASPWFGRFRYARREDIRVGAILYRLRPEHHTTYDGKTWWWASDLHAARVSWVSATGLSVRLESYRGYGEWRDDFPNSRPHHVRDVLREAERGEAYAWHVWSEEP